MKKEKILDCEDIRWKKIEDLFSVIQRREVTVERREDISWVEFGEITDHAESCEKCRETLIGLAEKHGITKGVIYPKEGEEKQRR